MSGESSDAGLVAAIVGGMLAVLGAIGAGIKWLIRWRERHQDRRAAKLQQWHNEIVEREKRLDAERARHLERIERDLGEMRKREEAREERDATRDLEHLRMRREHDALHAGYQLIAGALRAIDPANQALRMADELLRAAFPPDPVTPADMVVKLGEIDAAERGDER